MNQTTIWEKVSKCCLCALIFLAPIMFLPELSFAQEPSLPGTIDSTGTHFQITDSSYLNVALDSSQSIKLNLQSVPEMLTMQIEPDPAVSPPPNSTQLTISGLSPNTTYYLYQDNYHNETQFIADSNGVFSFTQDLSSPHLLFIQPRKGTKFIKDDPTGGDCSQIGTWNSSTKTCTLTQNVFETIQIDSDYITLDGNNYTITGNYTGAGVYLPARVGVTIKNFTIRNFTTGIYLYGTSGSTVNNNTLSLNSYGIYFTNSSYNAINQNNIFSNTLGIYSYYPHNYYNTISNNSISYNNIGAYIYFAQNTTFNNNAIFSNIYTGVHWARSNDSVWRNNTIYANLLNFSSYDLDINDIDTTNIVDGKPIYYFVNASNQIIDGATNAGVVYCIYCNNVTVKDLTLSNNGYGVHFLYTTNSRIENISALNNSTAISLRDSSANTVVSNQIFNNVNGIGTCCGKLNNTITDNTLTSNNFDGISLVSSGNTVLRNSISSSSNGIYLYYYDDGNIISENTISNSSYGLYLYSSDNNIINKNTLTNNSYGVYFTQAYTSSYLSNNNQIYNNNLTNNSTQIVVNNNLNNLFNLSLPQGGNYWSNFDTPQEGCDDANSDRTCDSPYIFTGGQDNYPWAIQNGWLAPTNQAPTISNLNQYKSDGVTAINENGITQESTIIFKSTLQDPDNDQIKLQVELKEKDQSFDGTGIIESDFVSSGSVASKTRDGLIPESYHWRTRAIDDKGNASDWQEFGTQGNIDFTVGRTIKVAVILAEPSDKSFDPSHNKQYFEQNIIPNVKDYYCEVSFGKRIAPFYSPTLSPCDDGLVNLDFKVFDSNGTPYKLSKNQLYYSQNFSVATVTIGTDGSDNEILIKDTDRTMEFAWEAINKADASDPTINYNDYETVIVVYYGTSQQTAFVSDDEWLSTQMLPASFSLTDSPSEFARNWITVAENDSLHGWAHEFGHALGKILRNSHLCDLYADTMSFCEYHGAVVEWDVMGAHDIGNELFGLQIPHFSSFSKLKLNWLTDAESTITYGSHPIESLETMKFGEKIKKYDLPNNSYYLLEARTNNSEYSKWDAGLFKDALVIYKVAPKELTIGSETRTVPFVNVAKDIGTIIPDLPYRDPVNNVLIGINNWFADPSSFRIDAQVSQLNSSNYIGAVLQPKLSLLEKILEFGISPLRNQHSYNIAELGKEMKKILKEKKLTANTTGEVSQPIVEINQIVHLSNRLKRFITDKFNIFLILVIVATYISAAMINRKLKKAQGQNQKIKFQKRYKTIIIIMSLLILLALVRMVFASTQPIISSASNIIPLRISEGLGVSDLDLHAITPDGKHTGVNYQTGGYENQIPNAIASGDLVYDDEWIFAPEGTMVKYYVSSYDVEQFLNENLDIAQQLPSTQETYTLSAMYYDSQSQKYESTPLPDQPINPGEQIIHQTQGTTDIQVTPGVVDNQAPTISHTQLQSEYILNSPLITFNFSADDGQGVGVKQIAAKLDGNSITNNQTISFNQIGTHTIEIIASDYLDNASTKIITFNVVYNFSGYLPPIKADGTGIYKLGRTLPVKFQLTDANNQYISIATAQLFVAKVSNGIVGTDEIPLSASNADTGNLFRYDQTNNQYIYNLSTDTLSVGSWQLKVVLDDNQDYTVVISIK